jgi:hypothetical protein
LVRGFLWGWLQPENLNVLHNQGERDALSHVEFLLIWGHLGKRRKLLLR